MNMNITNTKTPNRLFTRRVISLQHLNAMFGESTVAKDNLPKPPAQPIVEVVDTPAAPVEETGKAECVPELIQIEIPEVLEPQAEPETTSVDELHISSAYKRSLKANSIYTIESLQQFVDSGKDLADLKEIGAKSAAGILEGLNEWLSAQKPTTL